MFNIFALYFGHLRSSNRVLVISAVGLICALTMVSSTNYYFDNSKKAIIDDYFSNYGSSNDIQISFSRNFPYDANTLSNTINTINQTQKEYNINYFKSITSFEWISGLTIPVNFSSYYYDNSDKIVRYYMQNSSITVIELTDDYLPQLTELNNKNSMINGSYIPTTAIHSGIPYVYVLFLNFQGQNNQIQLNNSRYDNLYDNFNNNFTIKVAGVGSLLADYYIYDGSQYIINPDFNKYSNLTSLRYKYNWYSNIFVFTTSLKDFSSIFHQNIYTNKPHYDLSSQPSCYYSISISLDYSNIDPYNAGGIIKDVNSFISKLYDTTTISQYQNLKIYFYAQYTFQSLQGILTGFLFSLLLVSLPVLIATIFVINYSFGLIYKNIVRHIGIYKTRGATSWMIFYFQVVDSITIIIGSILVGLLSGVPLTLMVLRTDFLLSFNYPAPSYYILNFEAVASLLVYTAIILILIVNTFRLKKLSQLSIEETEQPVEKGEPFWKRHYLDISMFLFGMIMYAGFYILTKNPDLVTVLGPIISILVLFMIPAPFALVLGLVLFVNRLIPIVLNKIGTILWEKTGDLIAFSFKNVIRHKQASTRAIMLIAILLSFMVFFYSLPYSMVLSNERNLYYNNGADVVGSFSSNGYNQTELKIIQTNFSKYLDGFSPFIILSSSYGDFYSNPYSGNDYRILLINTSTYLKSAYLDFDLGLKNNINDDFKALDSSNTSDGSSLNILVDQTTLNNRRAHIGNTLTMPSSNNSLKLLVVDSFRNWPFLKPNFGYTPYTTFGIGNIDFYFSAMNKSLDASPFQSILDQGIFFNFKSGFNQTLISSWIAGNTSISIRSITEESQKQFYTGIQFRLQVGQINNDVIMVLLISIVVLIMFAYLQLTERKREIYTERAIGIKLHQIAFLFFIETIILSLTSIILGLSVGVFLMELLAILLLDPLQSYPAFEIVFPVEIIVITTGLILICSILLSVIPAYFVTKQDISKSFGEL